jgi:glutamyl-tRNA synthetase
LPDYGVELYINKKMKTDVQLSLTTLSKARDALAALSVWDKTQIHDALVGLATSEGYKNGQVMYPVRVALSGKEFTPGGALELADLFGKEETLRRINIGLEKLKHAV